MRKTPTNPVTPDRRALLAAEHGPGVVCAARARCRVALVYPNTYHIGMSSLGFQIAWQTIASHPGARAERFFMDTLAAGSLESGAPLQNFDLIVLSAAYEMDGPHILDLIAAAGLPLEARRRGDSSCPLVLMGGVLVSVNRLPLYPFIDVFCHGEAEVILPALLERFLEMPTVDRAELLAALATVPGLEVTAGALLAAGLPLPAELEPLAHDPADFDPLEEQKEAAGVVRPSSFILHPSSLILRPSSPPPALIPTLRDSPFTTRVLTPHTEFSNMALLDLARGCPHHCTFCWIGHNAPAYRVRDIDEILREVDVLARHTDRFGLVASAVGAHPHIDELCTALMQRGLKVSYSSLRVEEVSSTMLQALAAGGQKTVTIAPEAGAPRVRRLLGKKISDEQIFEVSERIFGLGVENLKLYFMIGVPSETDEEAIEIAAFTEKIRAIMLRWARGRGRIGTIGINLGIFVPKPNLPLNHIEPVPLAAIRKRLRLVVQRLSRIPNLHVSASSPELARAQAVLSMGGIEAALYLIRLRRAGGDWREANRAWHRRHDATFAWRFDQARLAGAALRSHAGA